jgi:hypothetical protein
MEQAAISNVRLETLLAIEVVDTRSTTPSTTFATPASVVAGRCRETKQRHNRKHVTRRSIDWKLVNYVFEPLHARFDFTLEGCAHDDGLNSHGDLPHCSPSDSILERDLSGERVFINPPRELAEQIGLHFESCRRTAPTSTMAVFVLPKWAKFTQLTEQWKLYKEFPARTHLFTRQSLENPARQEVVAPTLWHVQLWLVDDDCTFNDQTPPTIPDQPTSVHVPPVDTEESIATLQQFSPPATTLLTDLTEARPLILTEPIVKTPDGGLQIFGLVDCAATLDFVSEDFVRRFAL